MSVRADIDPVSTPAGRLPFGLPAAFVALIALHGAAAVLLGQMSSYRFDPGMAQILGLIMTILVPWFLLVLLIRQVVLLARVEKSREPIRDLMTSLGRLFRDRDRMLGGALRLLLACFFVGASAYLKEMITVLNPFSWDEAFARLDRLLHFGTDPFRLTLAAFGSAWATTFLNGAYHFWFFLVYFVTFVACFAKSDDPNARAYLIGFVLVFAVGGNLLALAFSSAGPVYYERMGLGSDFEPLMDHLRALNEISPVWALGVQEGLWTGHTTDGRLAGISAMPSMHVATSVLMALYAARHARWAGWCCWTFAALIMIGSVHLGWHYAVDGYLGALVAWAAWIAGKRLSAF